MWMRVVRSVEEETVRQRGGQGKIVGVAMNKSECAT